MNDTEQYHTGRAAAYSTAESFLKTLLHEHQGAIPREAIEDLRSTFYRLQMEAERSADQVAGSNPSSST